MSQCFETPVGLLDFRTQYLIHAHEMQCYSSCLNINGGHIIQLLIMFAIYFCLKDVGHVLKSNPKYWF